MIKILTCLYSEDEQTEDEGCISFGYNGITEWLGLEGPLKIIWFQLPAIEGIGTHYTRLLSAPT